MTDEQEQGVMTPGAENYTPLEARTVERLTDAQVEHEYEEMLKIYLRLKYPNASQMAREGRRAALQQRMNEYGITLRNKKELLEMPFQVLDAWILAKRLCAACVNHISALWMKKDARQPPAATACVRAPARGRIAKVTPRRRRRADSTEQAGSARRRR